MHTKERLYVSYTGPCARAGIATYGQLPMQPDGDVWSVLSAAVQYGTGSDPAHRDEAVQFADRLAKSYNACLTMAEPEEDINGVTADLELIGKYAEKLLSGTLDIAKQEMIEAIGRLAVSALARVQGGK